MNTFLTGVGAVIVVGIGFYFIYSALKTPKPPRKRFKTWRELKKHMRRREP